MGNMDKNGIGYVSYQDLFIYGDIIDFLENLLINYEWTFCCKSRKINN